jgi:hypothetical protein
VVFESPRLVGARRDFVRVLVLMLVQALRCDSMSLAILISDGADERRKQQEHQLGKSDACCPLPLRFLLAGSRTARNCDENHEEGFGGAGMRIPSCCSAGRIPTPRGIRSVPSSYSSPAP